MSSTWFPRGTPFPETSAGSQNVTCLLTGPNMANVMGIFRVLSLCSLAEADQIKELHNLKTLLQSQLIEFERLFIQQCGSTERNPALFWSQNPTIWNEKRIQLFEQGSRDNLSQLYFLDHRERIGSPEFVPLLGDCFHLSGAKSSSELYEKGFLIFSRNSKTYRIYLAEEAKWHPLYEAASCFLYVQDAFSVSSEQTQKAELDFAESLAIDSSSTVNHLHTTPVFCLMTHRSFISEKFSLGKLTTWKSSEEMEKSLKTMMEKKFIRAKREYRFSWLDFKTLLGTFCSWFDEAANRLESRLMRHASLTKEHLNENPVEIFVQNEKQRYFLGCPLLIDGNKSSYLDSKSWSHLQKALQKKPILYLSLRNNGKAPIFSDFCKALACAKHLKHLNVSACGLKDSEVRVLCQQLKETPIQQLIVSNNEVTWRSHQWLSDLLQKNSSLKKLDVSMNQLSPIGGLVNGVLTSCSLSQLFLWNCGLTDVQDSNALETLVAHTQTLESLSLMCNSLSQSTSTKLRRALTRNVSCPLSSLNLPNVNAFDFQTFQVLIQRNQQDHSIKNSRSVNEIEGVGQDGGLPQKDHFFWVDLKLNVVPMDKLMKWNEIHQIRVLNISKNQITEFPESLKNLKRLEHLTAHDNQIQRLGRVLLELKELESLDLRNNEIQEIDVDLREMKSLKTLLLQGNRLKNIRLEDIMFHGRLEMCCLLGNNNQQQQNKKDQQNNNNNNNHSNESMTKNDVMSRERENGLEDWKGLIVDNYLRQQKELDLSWMGIQVFPEELYVMSHLTSLDLSNNRLQRLGPEIGLMKELKELNVSGNEELEELAWQLNKCEKLEKLNVEGTGVLKKLNNSVQSNNQLSPKQSGTRTNNTEQKELSVREMIEIGSQSGQEKSVVNTCKIRLMFVGQSGVGKSSLCSSIQEFTSNKKNSQGLFSQKLSRVFKSEKTESNEGLRIVNWQVNTEQGVTGKAKKPNKEETTNGTTQEKETETSQGGEGNVFQYTAYDLGGQKMNSLSQLFFLSKESIYLVVFNLQRTSGEDLNEIDQWINTIKTFVKGKKSIIVVGTHSDVSSKNLTSKRIEELERIFSEKYNLRLVVTSASKKKGIEQLCEEIQEIGRSNATTPSSSKIPKRMALLEEYLFWLRAQKAVLTFEQLQRKVKLFELQETEQQTIERLKDSGDILIVEESMATTHNKGGSSGGSSGDKSRSGAARSGGREGEKLVVLDAQWLSSLFSTLIAAQEHGYIIRGQLAREHLKEIWRGPLFPDALHSSFIELLEKLGTVYRLKAKNYHNDYQRKTLWSSLLIPSLLETKRRGHEQNQNTAFNSHSTTDEDEEDMFEFEPAVRASFSPNSVSQRKCRANFDETKTSLMTGEMTGGEGSTENIINKVRIVYKLKLIPSEVSSRLMVQLLTLFDLYSLGNNQLQLYKKIIIGIKNKESSFLKKNSLNPHDFQQEDEVIMRLDLKVKREEKLLELKLDNFGNFVYYVLEIMEFLLKEICNYDSFSVFIICPMCSSSLSSSSSSLQPTLRTLSSGTVVEKSDNIVTNNNDNNKKKDPSYKEVQSSLSRTASHLSKFATTTMGGVKGVGIGGMGRTSSSLSSGSLGTEQLSTISVPNEKYHYYEVSELRTSFIDKRETRITCSNLSCSSVGEALNNSNSKNKPSAASIQLVTLAPHLVLEAISQKILISLDADFWQNIIYYNDHYYKIKNQSLYLPFQETLRRNEFSQVIRAVCEYSQRQDHRLDSDIISALFYASSDLIRDSNSNSKISSNSTPNTKQLTKLKFPNHLQLLIDDEINRTRHIETLFRGETAAVLLMSGCAKLPQSQKYAFQFVSAISDQLNSEKGCSDDEFTSLVRFSLGHLLTNINNCPRVIKYVCRTLADCIERSRKSELQNQRNRFLGSFFFLRFIVPSMFRMSTKYPEGVKKVLFQLGRVLQQVSNGTELAGSLQPHETNYQSILDCLFAALIDATPKNEIQELTKENSNDDDGFKNEQEYQESDPRDEELFQEFTDSRSQIDAQFHSLHPCRQGSLRIINDSSPMTIEKVSSLDLVPGVRQDQEEICIMEQVEGVIQQIGIQTDLLEIVYSTSASYSTGIPLSSSASLVSGSPYSCTSSSSSSGSTSSSE